MISIFPNDSFLYFDASPSASGKNVTELPKFFLVPSKEVARYVKWEHNHWLKSRKNEVQSTTMRNFRIEVNDPKGYCNNWEVFKLHD